MQRSPVHISFVSHSLVPILFALFLAAAGGCLPSPHQPLGASAKPNDGPSGKTKSSHTPGNTAGNVEIKVPVFQPKSTDPASPATLASASATTKELAVSPMTTELPSQPAAPAARDAQATQPINRLTLTQESTRPEHFADAVQHDQPGNAAGAAEDAPPLVQGLPPIKSLDVDTLINRKGVEELIQANANAAKSAANEALNTALNTAENAMEEAAKTLVDTAADAAGINRVQPVPLSTDPVNPPNAPLSTAPVVTPLPRIPDGNPSTTEPPLPLAEINDGKDDESGPPSPSPSITTSGNPPGNPQAATDQTPEDTVATPLPPSLPPSVTAPLPPSVTATLPPSVTPLPDMRRPLAGDAQANRAHAQPPNASGLESNPPRPGESETTATPAPETPGPATPAPATPAPETPGPETPSPPGAIATPTSSAPGTLERASDPDAQPNAASTRTPEGAIDVAPEGADPSSEVPLVNIHQQDAPITTNRTPVVSWDQTPIIPRSAFFKAPTRSLARISPDGKHIAFLADRNGVPNVFVAPLDDMNQAQPVTNDQQSGIQDFLWAYTCQHIVFLQSVPDAQGGSAQHVLVANLNTQQVRDLTPHSGAVAASNFSAFVASASHKHPTELVVAINDGADARWHQLYRVNLVSGQRRLLQENSGYEGFGIDDDYRVRIAYARTADGGRNYTSRSDHDQPWQTLISVAARDTPGTGIVGFDKTGDQIYVVDNRGRDLSVLKVIDFTKGREKQLAEHATADVAATLIHPTEKNVQAVTFVDQRQKWKILDSEIEADIEYLHSLEQGEVEISSRTLDDTLWTVVFRRDDMPARYYLYRREPRSTRLLFNSRPDLVDAPLVKMHTVTIPARDGKSLTSYVSLPLGTDARHPGKPDQPLPMVLLVHGGPWARDVWGYNDLHQMLANRGYAVLSVNYRGSAGFGKAFLDAGDGEWARKIHHDLLDGVTWAINEGIASQDRIAIVGGGFGGYASLVGLTFSPTAFACGIDISGPSNLITCVENPPVYWKDQIGTLHQRIGDPRTPEGRQLLLSRSPIQFADRIMRPILIAQGAKDPHAPIADAERLLGAARKNGAEATYLVFPEEAHGFERPPNRLAFYAVAEAFLARHLGGRAQPVGSALDQSSAELPLGAPWEDHRARLGAAP